MEQVRAVFFDAGGTLIYLDRRFLMDQVEAQGIAVTEPEFLAADRAATAHAVEQMRDGTAVNDRDRWGAYLVRLFDELGCGSASVDTIVPAIAARHAAGALWTYVEPGTAELLDALRRRGYTLIIVSNADGRVADFLHRAGLAEHFDAIVDSGAVGIEKPDPGIFRIALEQAGVAPHEAVHIGDILEIDVVGARAAGVHPVLFDPHGTAKANGVPIITALAELLDLLPGMHRAGEAPLPVGDARHELTAPVDPVAPPSHR
jgi:putative hydrolase of the HAD superfamily